MKRTARLALLMLASLVLPACSGGGAGPSTADRYPVTAEGSGLPSATDADDPAIGQPLPTLVGKDYQGREVRVASGPQVLVIGAHWCPHCNREIPKIVAWLASGDLPAELTYTLVSSAITEGAPNYPPGDWVADLGWDGPVLADDGTALAALGVAAFPTLIVVDADGRVAARLVGGSDLSTIRAALAAAGMG